MTETNYSQTDMGVTVNEETKTVVVTDEMHPQKLQYGMSYAVDTARVLAGLPVASEPLRIAGAAMIATNKLMTARIRRLEYAARQLDAQLTSLWEKDWPLGEMPDLQQLLEAYDRSQG